VIKLNAGFSRKVGEPNYGSRGASVNLELELESGLVSDPEALLGRIRKLFDLARRSVEQELSAEASAPTPENGRPARGGTRSATGAQTAAIRAICQRLGREPDQAARERFGVSRVADLTLAQASSLIDELKAAANGGGR